MQPRPRAAAPAPEPASARPHAPLGIPAYVRAQRGVAGATEPLPHVDTLQPAFGAHDLRGVRAAVGGDAATASAQVHAHAYTLGWRVAFAQQPDVRLAAHEAAHVVQQRAGISRADLGGPGAEEHERHADAVADAVVAGRSAEPLLDRYRATHEPTPVLQRKAYGTLQDDTVAIALSFRGEVVLLSLPLPDDALLAFTPELAPKLADAIETALTVDGKPAPETTRFVESLVVRDAIANDLTAWTFAPDGALATLTALIAERARQFAKQHVRADLEHALGIEDGNVDWATAIPELRMLFDERRSGSLRDESLVDRADFVLLVLENEVAAGPAVDGGAPPSADGVWRFATTQFHFADAESAAAFSEKELGAYADQIAALQFVPPGFDLAAFDPRGLDLAADERHRVLDDWIDANASEATTRIVLDDWTASGLDFRVYIKRIVIDDKKDLVLDSLTLEFERAARTDAELQRALYREADARASYTVLASLVKAGRALEASNRALQAAIDAPGDHPEYEAFAANPEAAWRIESALAAGVSGVITTAQVNGTIDGDVVAKAVQVAHDAPDDVGIALGLGVVLAALRAIGDQRSIETAHVREDIAARVDLSWGSIRRIVQVRGEAADAFLDDAWIPMLKHVAAEWVTTNYQQIDDAYQHFDSRWEQDAAKYELTAVVIDATADSLEHHEVESVEGGGQTLTIKDVPDLRTAAEVMRDKASKLRDPSGRDDIKDDLAKAREAYGRVVANILDGTYKPENYGEGVVVEAKRRLHIGMFEYATLWQQATRQVVATENPFQAYTIAMWRVTDIIDHAAADIIGMFVTIGLTVGSLILPGVAGAVLTGIDIVRGVVGAAGDIADANRRLDLARLDTNLTIQGVSVEDAKHALHMAWVGMVITLVTAGMFGSLLAGKGLKALRRLRVPNFAKLVEADALLAEKLLKAVGGDLKTIDSLLGAFKGDGLLVHELLAYCKDGASLLALTGKVKDAELLVGLLRAAGSESALLTLLPKFRDYKVLEELLGLADAATLLRIRGLCLADEVAPLLRQFGAGSSGTALALLEHGLSPTAAMRLHEWGAISDFFAIAQGGEAGIATARRLLASADQAAARALLGLRDGSVIAKLVSKAGGEAMAAKLLGEYKAAGTPRALAVLDTGLSAADTLKLGRIGVAEAYLRLAGDADALAAAKKLIADAPKNEVLRRALDDTAAFFDAYAGRASGDFVTRFKEIAEGEERLAQAQQRLERATAEGKGVNAANGRVAEAEQRLAQSRGEQALATDILEGRTPYGNNRTVHGIPARNNVETPDFLVGGTGDAPAAAEAKALGNEQGATSERGVRKNFRKAASQLRSETAVSGQTGGMIRLDAGANTFPQTNEQLRAWVNGEWSAMLAEDADRAAQVRYVELFDAGGGGARQRLLLRLDGTGVTIDAAGTTRP